MPANLSKIKLTVVFLVLSFTLRAQKGIVINDSLSANAEKMNVKLGSKQFGKIWKMKFGNYAVVSSKMGWTKTSVKQDLFGVKTESRSTNKFSFVLANGMGDSANVNAANDIAIESLRESRWFLKLRDEEWSKENKNFTAFITINHDTTETWSLLVNITTRVDSAGNYRAFLTNGSRIIFINAVSSGEAKTMFTMPASGYEFVENGQSVSALQYYGGGAAGMNKDVIWLRTDLDARMKLLLAAASTAILEVKMNEVTLQ